MSDGITDMENEKEAIDLDLLEKYTQYLLKEGYCDVDVYAEEPTAIDGFIKSLKP